MLFNSNIMRKIVALLLLVVLFSCGSDEPVVEVVEKIQKITVKIDGVSRVFDEKFSTSFKDQNVIFRLEDKESSDWISFEIEENKTGTDFVSEFVINLNGVNFIPSPMSPLGEFTTTISKNNSTGIEGIFSGGLAKEFNASTPDLPEVELKNGIIKIER